MRFEPEREHIEISAGMEDGREFSAFVRRKHRTAYYDNISAHSLNRVWQLFNALKVRGWRIWLEGSRDHVYGTAIPDVTIDADPPLSIRP